MGIIWLPFVLIVIKKAQWKLWEVGKCKIETASMKFTVCIQSEDIGYHSLKGWNAGRNTPLIPEWYPHTQPINEEALRVNYWHMQHTGQSWSWSLQFGHITSNGLQMNSSLGYWSSWLEGSLTRIRWNYRAKTRNIQLNDYIIGPKSALVNTLMYIVSWLIKTESTRGCNAE